MRVSSTQIMTSSRSSSWFDPNPRSLLKGTDLGNAPARVFNTNFVRLEYWGLGWYYEHDHRVCWYFELIIGSVGILIGLLVF